MQINQLSRNGVDKLINDLNCVLQVIDSQQLEIGSWKYILSDGYAMLKNCIIQHKDGPSKTNLNQYDIIQVVKSQVITKEGKNNKMVGIMIIQFKLLFSHIQQMIGNPIIYDEYLKQGKKNQKGNNKIPQQLYQKNKKEDRSNDRSIPFTKSQYSNNSIPKKTEFKKQEPKQPPKKPIQQINHNSNNKSHNLKVNSSIIVPIKELYQGLQDWRIVVRVLSVSPLKDINTKRGPSQVLSLIVGDNSGVINMNIFGGQALRYEKTFELDKAYSISKGNLIQSTWNNKTQLKISLNQYTIVSLIPDDSNIRFTQDFAITVSQLITKPISTQHMIVCLVKDINQINHFTSKKTGKDMCRKVIMLCDPQSLIEIQLTLWNETSNMTFEKSPYFLMGILVDEYQNQKQYTTAKFNFSARPLKHHHYRKYLKNFENLEFKTMSGKKNTAKQPQCTNFIKLMNQIKQLKDKDKIWTETICYVNSIRQGNNLNITYISCPNCKKKVPEEKNSTCPFCQKEYTQAKARYILRMNICDCNYNIWATGYDDVGEKILGDNGVDLTADAFLTLSEDQIKQKLRTIKYKPFRMKISSQIENYNNSTRYTHKVNKIFPFDPIAQSQKMLKSIKASLMH